MASTATGRSRARSNLPPVVQHVRIHGHDRAYVQLGPEVGTAPALLLLHGLGCDHTTWSPVIWQLARHYTVIAPDMLGHGASAKPRADYSVGGFANGVRDMLTVLGIEKVTVVGHSLGGGVAMQFAYQFPERTERLVLVAPGGLGPEVSPLIRAVTLPGYEPFMAAATLPGIRHAGRTVMRALHGSGLAAARDLDEVAKIYDSFRDRPTRAAIRHVVRAVVDLKGQVITMADRAYLTEAMPVLVVWGADDRVIPVSHAETAARLAPGAVIEVMADAGHFPHRDHPKRFVRVVNDFIRHSQPARYHRAQWRALMRQGPPVPADLAEAGDAPLAPVTRLSRVASR
ncbi:MAG: alpha/beta fold hydrolase [Marmoricola sp.]